jgi:hypothetical protein
MLLFSTLEITIHNIQSTSKVIVEENVNIKPNLFYILFLKINFYLTFEQNQVCYQMSANTLHMWLMSRYPYINMNHLFIVIHNTYFEIVSCAQLQDLIRKLHSNCNVFMCVNPKANVWKTLLWNLRRIITHAKKLCISFHYKKN